ncbi:MAG: RMD1 family protein [Leptolyngbya sp. DLM2.Bin27]|nr:MAG: RMD1 family protein [Leptolyngbya sp. DLM2.Bin27]
MTFVNPVAAIAASAEITDVPVRAYFLGQRIDLRAMAPASPESPLIVPVEDTGQGVLFSYGAVVLFGLSEPAEQAFIATLKPYIQTAFERPETEAVTIRLAPNSSGKVQDGMILLSSLDEMRLRIVADVMAKSVVLAHYELEAAAVFDRIEPYAVELQYQRPVSVKGNQLLNQIGQTLMIQHKIVGRVEMVDKPELLWEYPDLDPLYHRLEDEYEIRDRHSALERKLDLVSRTAETVLDLQRHQTGLRLEWYVVLLIVVEVLLSLYDLFLSPRV